MLGGAKGNMAGAVVADQFINGQNGASGSAIAVSLIISILVVLGLAAATFTFSRRLLAMRRHVTVAGR